MNEDLVITRRTFFKQLRKKTLPFLSLFIVGSIALSSCRKEDDESEHKPDCNNECRSSCSITCSGTCDFLCAVACGGSCTNSCIYVTK